jgi:hypothetical protein
MQIGTAIKPFVIADHLGERMYSLLILHVKLISL